MSPIRIILSIIFIGFTTAVNAQTTPFKVIAYFSGKAPQVDAVPAEKITHIIFSFCHLQGNQLHVDNAGDTVTIKKLVALKKRNPQLRVLLSLGGWTGCGTCSPVFSTAAGRTEFASSVKALMQYFKTDGIDLDWEYPAIEGPREPGHPYAASDKQNFTSLVQSLRDTLGTGYDISFAAGGFTKYLEESIEWHAIMPLVDYVNLMTYDLVGGYNTVTGHHTPLYSNPKQKESTHNAVSYLDSIGFPKNKLIIGAAFYGRTWESVSPVNNGLYQSGKFKSFVDYKDFGAQINTKKGFKFYYDNTSKASYAYNRKTRTFATFDDKRSIAIKTKYAMEAGLGGIMFWEMTLDKKENSLLDVIDGVLKKK